jgi:serine-type D-Ala-D-Ala carboxypeptidase/endopeptidase (penicillin-binding protein 4)
MSLFVRQLWWCLLLTGCATSVGRTDLVPAWNGVQSSSPYTPLKQEIDLLLNEKLLPQSIAALEIVSLDSGDVIYQSNPHMLMIPASNQKLFTAAAALAQLGPERFIETSVSRGGEEKRDLYLKGCGDALLTDQDLRRLAKETSARLIPGETYRLVGDVSCFDDLYWGKGWIWDDEPDPDEMFITPLSVNGNAISVAVSPGSSVGAAAAARVIPPTSFVTIRNRVTTSPEKIPSAVSIQRHPGERENVITVSGTIPLGTATVAQRVSVWQPERYTLALFREYLKSDGIQVSESLFGTTPPAVELLAVRSRTVSELVVAMLKESDNLSAENLLKFMAHSATQSPGSAGAGIRLVRRFLEERGIATAPQVIADGSGVSRYNLVTAHTIISLLEEMHRDSVNFPLFYRALAKAGQDGTLALRMRHTAAEGKVVAKSGTMNGISALSGYLTTTSGKLLAFSILIQNYAGTAAAAREVQNRICILLSNFGEGAARH